VVDLFHVKYRERVSQAVVTEVVAEGPFGKLQPRINGTRDVKIRLAQDGKLPRGTNDADPAATQGAGESQLG
jgi:hypothetical protein